MNCRFPILISIVILISAAIVSVGAEEAISKENDSFEGDVHPDSFFDVKIVSPEMLDTIRSNMGQQGQVLKADRGVVIGVIAGTSLYIRGDLNEDDFPLENIVEDDTKIRIANHLLDIVFGSDNPKITLFKSDLPYYVWFDRAYSSDDIAVTRKYLQELNNLSATMEFEEEEIGLTFLTQNYDPLPYHYYTISVISDEMLKDLEEDRNKDQDHLLKAKSGKLIGMVNQDHLWLSELLSREEYDYYILKGLLFSMGFHGESEDPKSFFERTNEKPNLSDLDRQAIMMMYGGRITDGMDMDAAEIALDLKEDLST